MTAVIHCPRVGKPGARGKADRLERRGLGEDTAMTAENRGAEQEGDGPLARLARRLRDEARPLPGVRALRTGLRAAHIMTAAVLYGGHVYGVSGERLLPALAATQPA